MTLVYKLHIQGGSDSTTPFPNNHPYITISSCKSQLAETSFYCSYLCIKVWLFGKGKRYRKKRYRCHLVYIRQQNAIVIS